MDGDEAAVDRTADGGVFIFLLWNILEVNRVF